MSEGFDVDEAGEAAETVDIGVELVEVVLEYLTLFGLFGWCFKFCCRRIHHNIERIEDRGEKSRKASLQGRVDWLESVLRKKSGISFSKNEICESRVKTCFYLFMNVVVLFSVGIILLYFFISSWVEYITQPIVSKSEIVREFPKPPFFYVNYPYFEVGYNMEGPPWAGFSTLKSMGSSLYIDSALGGNYFSSGEKCSASIVANYENRDDVWFTSEGNRNFRVEHAVSATIEMGFFESNATKEKVEEWFYSQLFTLKVFSMDMSPDGIDCDELSEKGIPFETFILAGNRFEVLLEYECFEKFEEEEKCNYSFKSVEAVRLDMTDYSGGSLLETSNRRSFIQPSCENLTADYSLWECFTMVDINLYPSDYYIKTVEEKEISWTYPFTYTGGIYAIIRLGLSILSLAFNWFFENFAQFTVLLRACVLTCTMKRKDRSFSINAGVVETDDEEDYDGKVKRRTTEIDPILGKEN